MKITINWRIKDYEFFFHPRLHDTYMYVDDMNAISKWFKCKTTIQCETMIKITIVECTEMEEFFFLFSLLSFIIDATKQHKCV